MTRTLKNKDAAIILFISPKGKNDSESRIPARVCLLLKFELQIICIGPLLTFNSIIYHVNLHWYKVHPNYNWGAVTISPKNFSGFWCWFNLWHLNQTNQENFISFSLIPPNSTYTTYPFFEELCQWTTNMTGVYETEYLFTRGAFQSYEYYQVGDTRAHSPCRWASLGFLLRTLASQIAIYRPRNGWKYSGLFFSGDW